MPADPMDLIDWLFGLGTETKVYTSYIALDEQLASCD
jgi:hypothetical protein